MKQKANAFQFFLKNHILLKDPFLVKNIRKKVKKYEDDVKKWAELIGKSFK